MSRCLLILLFIVAGSCKKNNSIKSSGLYLNTCTSKTFNAEEISVCFDNVNDSRCPSDVECVWAGVAIARFTLIKNGVSHPFTLTTLPVFHQYSSDTTVAGYNFHLVNILPYPKFSSPAMPADIYAVLDISKQ
jgi:hypothetical protein